MQRDLPDRVRGAIASAFYGGWMWAAIVHVPAPAALFDISGAYSWSFSVQDLWRLVVAKSIEVLDVTDEVRAIGRSATLIENLCHGIVPFETRPVLVRVVTTGCEKLPTKPKRAGRSRLVVANTDLSGAANWWWLSDLLAGVALGGAFPAQIVEAIEFVPLGVRDGLQPVRLPSGREVDPYGEDLVLAIREERDRLRLDNVAPGSERLADLMRLLGTTISFGNMSRVDRSTLRRPVVEEVIGPDGVRITTATTHPSLPGPYFDLLVAGAVTARVRLAIASTAAGIEVGGGAWLHVATDSLLIAATGEPKAQFVPCPGGSKKRAGRDGVLALPVAEVVQILEATAVPWRAKRGHDQPLTGLVLGTNRYAVLGSGEGDSVATESGLGGVYADPTGTGERTPEGHWKWAVDAHLAVARSEANWNGRGELLGIDLPGWKQIPAVRLGVATTSDQLDRLIRAFPGATIRPFTRFLTAVLAPSDAGHVAAITLDVDLPPAKWLDARWANAGTGEPLSLTTSDNPKPGTYRVRTYGELIDAWRRADDQFSEPVSPQDHVLQRGVRRALPVVSHPELVELVGKEGDDLLRQLSDPLSLPDDDLTIYRVADRWPAVLAIAKSLGSRVLSSRGGLTLRTAQRVVKGEFVSDATKARVTAVVEELGQLLDADPVNVCKRPGCGRRIGARRKWCSESCRKKAERGRDAVDLHQVGAVRCPKCRGVNYGKRSRPCPSCGGKGVIEVRAFQCPECGVERIGNTDSPCPVCEKGSKS